MCVDGSANPHFVAAGDINYVGDEEALNMMEDSLRPPKYDPLDFWNHIQSRVNNCLTVTLKFNYAIRRI